MTISYSGTTFVGETYAADVVVTEKGSPIYRVIGPVVMSQGQIYDSHRVIHGGDDTAAAGHVYR